MTIVQEIRYDCLHKDLESAVQVEDHSWTVTLILQSLLWTGEGGGREVGGEMQKD